MNLGQFSLSLAVSDIGASLEFYRKLGFEVIDGKVEEHWLILRNGEIVIGLFQGMFDRNLLTFNPSDVRSVQKELLEKGVELIEKAEEGDGPAHITMVDPDGNPILLDQHDPTYELTRRDGGVVWADTTADDAETLRDFYSSVVGWKPSEVPMGGYADYSMMRPNGLPASGVCHRRGVNADLPGGWLVYFSAADLDAALEACTASGGQIIAPARGDESYRFAVIRDPAGGVCALTEGE